MIEYDPEVAHKVIGGYWLGGGKESPVTHLQVQADVVNECPTVWLTLFTQDRPLKLCLLGETVYELLEMIVRRLEESE